MAGYPPAGSGSRRRKPLDPDVIKRMKKKWAERPTTPLPPTPPSHAYDPNKVKPDDSVFYRPSKRVRERRLRKKKEFQKGKKAYEAIQEVIRGTPAANTVPDQDWSDKAMRRYMKGRRGLTKEGAERRETRLREARKEANRKFIEGKGEFPGPYMYTDAHPDEVKFPTVDIPGWPGGGRRRVHQEELPPQLREEFKHLILPYDLDQKRVFPGDPRFGPAPEGMGTLVIPDRPPERNPTPIGGRPAYREWDPNERKYVWREGPISEAAPSPEDWARRPGSFPDITGRPGWEEAILPPAAEETPPPPPPAEPPPAIPGFPRPRQEYDPPPAIPGFPRPRQEYDPPAGRQPVPDYTPPATEEGASAPPSDEDRWGREALGLDDPEGAPDEVSRVNKILSNQAGETGDLHQIEGDYENAIEFYTKAIRLNPKNNVAYRSRSQAKLALGDKEGADADMDKAMELEGKGRGPSSGDQTSGDRSPDVPWPEEGEYEPPSAADLREELEREPEVDKTQIPETGLPDTPAGPGQHFRWNSELGQYEAHEGSARPEWKRLKDGASSLERQAQNANFFDKKGLLEKAEKTLSEAIFKSRGKADPHDRAGMLEQRAWIKQLQGDMKGAAKDNESAEFLKEQAREEERRADDQSSSNLKTPEDIARWTNSFVERITGGVA